MPIETTPNDLADLMPPSPDWSWAKVEAAMRKAAESGASSVNLKVRVTLDELRLVRPRFARLRLKGFEVEFNGFDVHISWRFCLPHERYPAHEVAQREATREGLQDAILWDCPACGGWHVLKHASESKQLANRLGLDRPEWMDHQKQLTAPQEPSITDEFPTAPPLREVPREPEPGEDDES